MSLLHCCLCVLVLTQVLRAQGIQSAAVAEQGCGAIAKLSENDVNTTKLGEAGACEGVYAY